MQNAHYHLSLIMIVRSEKSPVLSKLVIVIVIVAHLFSFSFFFFPKLKILSRAPRLQLFVSSRLYPRHTRFTHPPRLSFAQLSRGTRLETASGTKSVFLDHVSRLSADLRARNNTRCPWFAHTHAAIVGKLDDHAIRLHDSRVRVVSRSCQFFRAISVSSLSVIPTIRSSTRFSLSLSFSTVNEPCRKTALQLVRGNEFL